MGEILNQENRKVFVLTIEAIPVSKNWPPFSIRLRALLKAMLRSYGFKCVEIRPEKH